MMNARSYERAAPLAVATGVNIMIDHSSRMNSFAQGQLIRNMATIAGAEHVVMFWEHRRMLELARG